MTLSQSAARAKPAPKPASATAPAPARPQPAAPRPTVAPVAAVIAPASTPVLSRSLFCRARSISRTDAAQVASQLSVMLEAGVPLTQAIESLLAQCEKPHVQAALQAILADVRNGLDLSGAVARCPLAFPMVFARLLRAGEASGTMGPMLGRIAEYLQLEVDAIRKIRAAMAYPVAMMTLGLLAMVVIFGFLLPRFEVMYAGREALLPAPTKIALGISHAFRSYWYVLAGLAAAVVTGAVLFFRSAQGRLTTDWLKLHFPLINRMFRQFYVARSFQTMGTMIGSGVTVPEAVRLSRDVAGNSYFAHLWDVTESHLQAGQRLADPLFASTLVSKTVSQMVATGERSGNLAIVMRQIAILCEKDLQHTIKTVTGLLEPLMIIVLGGMIGSIVMAILLPVFRLSRVMAH